MFGKLAAAMSDAPGDSADRPRDLFGALARPLREQVCSGALAPGALLRSESRLAQDAKTSRYAIRKALTLLHDEGLIVPVPGRGWAVVSRTDDASSDTRRLPRYRRIAESLRVSIEAGRLAPGATLPSESELVAQWGVSRATVRQALGVLESEGLIRTYPGSGRRVC